MPPTKLERVRGGIEAFSSGDLDAALAGFHPDIVWEVGPDLMPDGRTYHGHDGVREFWLTWRQLFDQFRLEIEECNVVREDRVVVVTRAHGTGAGSGVPVESPSFTQIFDFRGDTVVRVRLRAGRWRG